MAGLHFESSVDRGFEQGIDRMMRKVDELNAKTTKKVDETSASFNRLQTAAMATFSTVAMGAFVGKVIEVRSEIQSLEIAFTSMLQSKQASQKLMADIIQTAATTPYSVIEIAGNAKKLMAFGESAETVISVTRRLGDVASATGSDIGGIALAYGQVMAKGRLQTQELNQLQERGIPIMEELAKMYGKNKTQITADIEAQKIGFNDLKQVIFNLTAEGGKFYNLMAENAKTLRGQVSNLGDKFNTMLDEIGAANDSILSGGIEGLSILVKNWEVLADTIGTVVIAYGAYKAAVMAFDAVQGAGKITAFISDLKAVYTYTMLNASALGTATAAQEAFNLAGWANPYALLVGGIAAVVAGLALFVDWTDDSEQALIKLQTTISETTNKQNAGLIALKETVNKVNASDTDRIKVIDKLNESYGKQIGYTFSLADGNLKLVESLDALIAKQGLQNAAAQTWNEITAKTARLSDIKDMASGKVKYNPGFMESVSTAFTGGGGVGTIGGNLVARKLAVEYEQLNTDIAKLKKLYEDTQNQLLAGEKGKGTDSVKARRIADIRNDIKVQNDAREQARTTDIEGIKKYNAEIKRLQLELDTLLGGGKEAKVDRSASIALLETEHTKRVTAINKQYAYDKTQAVEHQRSMLAEEADYLAKKSKLAGTDLERATIAQQQVANQQAQQRLAEKKTLAELLDEYKIFTDKKRELQDRYNEETARLSEAGHDAEANEAALKGQREIEQLEQNFVNQSEAYKRFMDGLPAIVEQSATAIEELMNRLMDSMTLEGDTGKLAVMASELKALQEQLDKLKKPKPLIDEDAAKETIDLLDDVHGRLESISGMLSNDTALSDIASAALSVSGSMLTAAQSVMALSGAMTTLKAASIVLVAISAALTAINAIVSVREKADERRDKLLAAELRYNNAINTALIEQIALYERGNELMASDNWGTALSGLEAYNEALKARKAILMEIGDNAADTLGKAKSSRGGSDKVSISGTYVSKAVESVSFVRKANAKNDAKIKATIDAQTNDAARALAGIEITTKKRNKLGKIAGLEDKTTSLLSRYPDLVDAQGNLNKVVLEQAVAEADVSNANKARLQGMLDNINTAEKAYAQFGDYIASIFGGVADSVAQSMMDAYIASGNSVEGIKSAMLSLEKSMSDMIEGFSRDIIELAFLQPLLDEVNGTVKALGAKRASGEVTNDQLQTGVIESLGAFYKGVNAIAPDILQAYAALDQLAASQGFDSAFNRDATGSNGTLSAGAQVAQQITEQTGTELVGRVNAIMLGVEKMSIATDRAYELSVKKLAILSRIGDNTDYLPEIAANTKKTADSLGA